MGRTGWEETRFGSRRRLTELCDGQAPSLGGPSFLTQMSTEGPPGLKLGKRDPAPQSPLSRKRGGLPLPEAEAGLWEQSLCCGAASVGAGWGAPES